MIKQEEEKDKKRKQKRGERGGESRFSGTEMERVEVNPQSGSLRRDCAEKEVKIKDRGKFGYAFANHELAMTFMCVCSFMNEIETEIKNGKGL